MNKLTFLNTIKVGVKKKSPQIMIGLGIAGGITTTVLAVKATPKAIRLLQEARYSKSGDGLTGSDNEEDLPSLTPVEVLHPGRDYWRTFDRVYSWGEFGSRQKERGNRYSIQTIGNCIR